MVCKFGHRVVGDDEFVFGDFSGSEDLLHLDLFKLLLDDLFKELVL